MKKIKTVLCVCFLIIINTSGVFADNTPVQLPQPDTGGVTTANMNSGEEPPNGPIDDNLIFLTISALILGSVVIYKNKRSFSINEGTQKHPLF